MPLLDVRGLEKYYGRRKVVDGVTFDVNQGEIVGLLGPNGAGKTTSFRMTIGLIDADGGQVLFDGQGRDPAADVQAGPGRHGLSRPGFRASSSSSASKNNLMAILETRPGMNRKARKLRQDELLGQLRTDSTSARPRRTGSPAANGAGSRSPAR